MNSQTTSVKNFKIIVACFFLAPLTALLGLYFDPRVAIGVFLLQLVAGLAFLILHSVGIWEQTGIIGWNTKYKTCDAENVVQQPVYA
jgi:hypothetical protein